MNVQVFDTSVIKPFIGVYEAAKKQLEQWYEMGVFSDAVINDESLKKGQFQEGSIYFNYEQGSERKSIRVIPYMNQKLGMHAFKHPIVLNTKDDATVVVFNSNAYGVLGVDGVVKIRQASLHQFNFMISYACVLGKVASGQLNREAILSFGHLPANAAAVCVSQALARSYSLDYSVQLNVQAVCAYFYYHTGLGFDTERSIELASMATKIPMETVKSLCEGTAAQDMLNIPDLALAIGQVCGSERLADMKPVVLYTMLKQYWLGDNGAELICAAYEMPHLWAFLCFSSMEHVLYKKNALSEIIKTGSKNFDAQQLSSRMRNVLSNEVM